MRRQQDVSELFMPRYSVTKMLIEVQSNSLCLLLSVGVQVF